ncbi:uncharacterized protein LOC134230838 [Saccostrea cucullata]|uniref:uncharacterized protein LOC134230838 n=1 Tax=Saccostrea cuccullata TaxID=36930 RepID=UPI002ED5566F
MAPRRGGRRLSLSMRNCILDYHKGGKSTVQIERILKSNHKFQTTRQSIRRFLNRYKRTGSVHDQRKPRGNEFRKVTELHLQFVNMWMSCNPEMTAQTVLEKLEKQCGIKLSREYVCEIRRRLNWSPKNMKYGQLISHKNVKHRLEWCITQLIQKDSFQDVIYVDESTVEMCSSGRLFFHQDGSNLDRLPAKAPKPKHSYKVNVCSIMQYRWYCESPFTQFMYMQGGWMKTKIGAIMDFYENHPGNSLENVWLEKIMKIPYPLTGPRVRVKINQKYHQYKWVTCTQYAMKDGTPVNMIKESMENKGLLLTRVIEDRSSEDEDKEEEIEV